MVNPKPPAQPPNDYFGGPFDEDPSYIPAWPRTFLDPNKKDRDNPRPISPYRPDEDYKGAAFSKPTWPISDPVAAAEKGEESVRGLQYGRVPGRLYTLPQYQNLGRNRPFGPGEFVRMPDGSITSEESYTVQLANGRWAVVPGIWLKGGVPTHVTEDEATDLANQSGLQWVYNYSTLQEADQYAEQREILWEMLHGDTRRQPPLWSRQFGVNSDRGP